ncbi:Uncharacterised protein [Serratia fonticola]|uniref:hypothetical protein n=1 Tax=Serratia fonticola TaxID=47917 RepID=UPI00218409CB|nr:hypothetical protein [Serratia fonticola]CAI2121243.1 Uncharacterised protein [Serratia fonticola]
MKYLRAIILNLVVLGSFIAAHFWLQAGMLNIAHFSGWLLNAIIIIGIACALSPEGQELYNKEIKTKPRWWYMLIIGFDVVFTLLFAWNGWFILAAVTGLTAIIKPFMRKHLEEQRVKKGAGVC